MGSDRVWWKQFRPHPNLFRWISAVARDRVHSIPLSKDVCIRKCIKPQKPQTLQGCSQDLGVGQLPTPSVGMHGSRRDHPAASWPISDDCCWHEWLHDSKSATTKTASVTIAHAQNVSSHYRFGSVSQAAISKTQEELELYMDPKNLPHELGSGHAKKSARDVVLYRLKTLDQTFPCILTKYIYIYMDAQVHGVDSWSNRGGSMGRCSKMDRWLGNWRHQKFESSWDSSTCSIFQGSFTEHWWFWEMQLPCHMPW